MAVPYRARFFPTEARPTTPWYTDIEGRTARSVGKFAGFPESPDHIKFRAVHNTALWLESNIRSHGTIGFIASVDQIYDRRDPDCPRTSCDLGSCVLTGGGIWSWCAIDSRFDFIDFLCEGGIVFPFNDPCHPRPGGAARGVLSAGIFDWLTAGACGQVIVFPRPGKVQFTGSLYAKADHFVRGFSVAIGFSYDRESCSNGNIAFTNNTFHLLCSYDLAQESHPNLPQVTFIFNQALSGKGCFAHNHVMGISVSFAFS